MSKAPICRIAFVQLNNKKSYPMKCDRTDIVEGCEVEVLSPDDEFINGVVTEIQHQRWDCQWNVECLASEVNYKIDEDGPFLLRRTVTFAPRLIQG